MQRRNQFSVSLTAQPSRIDLSDVSRAPKAANRIGRREVGAIGVEGWLHGCCRGFGTRRIIPELCVPRLTDLGIGSGPIDREGQSSPLVVSREN
jgi:hypothetical protein